MGAGQIEPAALEEAVGTMREGEKALVTIHPRVAYGASGDATRGIPPDAFLEYEVPCVWPRGTSPCQPVELHPASSYGTTPLTCVAHTTHVPVPGAPAQGV